MFVCRYIYPYAKLIFLFESADYRQQQDYYNHVGAIWRDGTRLPHVMGYERW